MIVRAARMLLVGATVGVTIWGMSGVAWSSTGVKVTNRDDKEQKITVLEEDGGKRTDHVLKPSQVLEAICLKGCIVLLNDSAEDEYELEGTEAVSIEDGYLYYDNPPDAPPGGQEAAQPTPPAATPGAAPAAPGAPPAAAPATPAPAAPTTPAPATPAPAAPKQ